MKRATQIAVLALACSCHGRSTSDPGNGRYLASVKRTIAWEELEARIFAKPPAARSDADLDAYLTGPSSHPQEIAMAQRRQLLESFRNSAATTRTESQQQTFDVCQASIENDMAAWFDKFEAGHRGGDPSCEIARASAVADRGCAKFDSVLLGKAEEKHCACERATVWKGVVEEAGVPDLAQKAAKALEGGGELTCP